MGRQWQVQVTSAQPLTDFKVAVCHSKSLTLGPDQTTAPGLAGQGHSLPKFPAHPFGPEGEVDK